MHDVEDEDNAYSTLEEFMPLEKQLIHEDIYLKDKLTDFGTESGNDRRLLSSEVSVSNFIIPCNGTFSLGISHLKN